MHVPTDKLLEYRRLMELSRMMKSMGNFTSGVGEYADANTLWGLAAKYRGKANELRVPGKGDGATE